MPNRFLSLLAIFFVFGCAHKPIPEVWLLSSGVPTSEALMVMDIDLDPQGHMADEHLCHLHLRFHDGSNSKLEIKSGARRYFWTAPVGRYELSHMSCGYFSRFNLEEFPAFRLQAGKSYYFGGIQLKIASREELVWNYTEMTKERFLAQLLSLPDTIKPQLYSPFSNKKITQNLIASTPAGPSVHILSGGGLEDFQKNWPLSRCLGEEQKINPLRAGLYHLNVRWQEGVSEPLIDRLNEAHLYTDSFSQCVNESLKQVSSMVRESAEVEIKL